MIKITFKMTRQSENKSLGSLVDKMGTKNLNQIKEYSLLNRTDTKYILNSYQAINLFREIKNEYYVLEVNSEKIQSYESYYFDTNEYLFYNQHHNRKNNRSKVRFRKYIGSDLIFLEIKTKSKGRTKKNRTRVNDLHTSLTKNHYEFVRKNLNNIGSLVNSQQNSFNRITLLGKKKKERITIDFNVEFKNNKRTVPLSDIIICEVKQEKIDRSSEIIKALKANKVYPFRLSKYCIGSILLDNKIKHNRFKKKLLKINKLQKTNYELN